MILVITLIILNIPVYLFLAWLVFDTADGAATTFLDTIVALLKIIFIPPLIRAVLDMDESGAVGVFPILAFFIACGAITYGEYWLLEKYVLGAA